MDVSQIGSVPEEIPVTKLPAIGNCPGVSIPTRFHDLINTKGAVAYNPINPGLTVIGAINNPLPIDTKNDKVPIGCPELESVFGNLKEPAFPVTHAESKHVDKIPLDRIGNVNLTRLKLQHCELNVDDMDGRDEDRLHQAARKLSEYLVMATGTSHLQPLSVNQAINGEKCEGLRPDSSTGASFQLLFPGYSTKEKLLAIRMDGSRCINDTIPGVFLSRLIDQQWEGWANGECITLPSALSFKSELLPHEKAWKKRLINCVDPATVINQKRLLAPVQHRVCSLGPHGPFQLETSPFLDWDQIAVHLRSVSDNILAMDFSPFDWTVPAAAIRAMGTFVSGFYKNQKYVKRRVKCMAQSIAYLPLLVGSTVLQKQGAIPSGIWGTSFVDTAILLILYYDAIDRVLYGDSPTLQMPVEEFFKNHVTKGCGDDFLAAVSETHKRKIDLNLVSKIFKEVYRMNATSDDKNNPQLAYVPLEASSFCSRKFVKMSSHAQFYIPKLKPEAISGILCWTRYQSPYGVAQQLEATRLELLAYGKDKYLQFEAAFRAYCLKHGVAYTPVTFETMELEAWNALTSVDPSAYSKLDYNISIGELQTEFSSFDIPVAKLYARLKEKVDLSTLVELPINTTMDRKVFISHLRASRTFTEFSRTISYRYLTELLEKGGWPSVSVLLPGDDKTRVDVPTDQHVARCLFLCKHWDRKIKFPDTYPDETLPKRFSNYNKVATTLCAAQRARNDPTEATWTAFLLAIPGLISDASQMADSPSGGPPIPNSCSASGTEVSDAIGNLAPIPPGPTAMPTPTLPVIIEASGHSGTPILEQAFGVTGANLQNLGYYASNLAYIHTPMHVRFLPLTTSTSALTDILMVPFDPWSAEYLSDQVLAHAKYHHKFVGGIRLKLVMTMAQMCSGTLGMYYIPGPYVANLDTNNLNALAEFQNVQLEVSQACSVELCIRAGTTSGFVVERDLVGDFHYGMLLIKTITPIQNTYGTQITISVRLESCLAQDASYSQFRLSDAGVGIDIPDVPTIADMLIDGHTTLYNPDQILLLDAPMIDYDGDYMTSGVYAQGTIYPDPTTAVEHEMRFYKGYPGMFKPSRFDLPTVIREVFDLPTVSKGRDRYYWSVTPRSTRPLPKYIWSLTNVTPAHSLPGGFSQIMTAFASIAHGISLSTSDVFTPLPATLQFYTTGGALYDKHHNVMMNCFTELKVPVPTDVSTLSTILGNTDPSEPVSQPNWAFNFRADYPSDVVCICNTTFAYNANVVPGDFALVRLLSDTHKIPAVARTAGVGGSMPDTVLDIMDHTALKDILKKYAAIITTFTDVSGRFHFQIVRNKYGSFARLPSVNTQPFFYLPMNTYTFKQTHNIATVDFPPIEPINLANWKSRSMANPTLRRANIEAILDRSQGLFGAEESFTYVPTKFEQKLHTDLGKQDELDLTQLKYLDTASLPSLAYLFDTTPSFVEAFGDTLLSFARLELLRTEQYILPPEETPMTSIQGYILDFDYVPTQVEMHIRVKISQRIKLRNHEVLKLYLASIQTMCYCYELTLAEGNPLLPMQKAALGTILKDRGYDVDHIDNSQVFGMVLGGALAGIGSGLTNLANQAHEAEMNRARFRHQMNLAEKKISSEESMHRRGIAWQETAQTNQHQHDVAMAGLSQQQWLTRFNVSQANQAKHLVNQYRPRANNTDSPNGE